MRATNAVPKLAGLSEIPSVSRILQAPELEAEIRTYGRPAVTTAVREVLHQIRSSGQHRRKNASVEVGALIRQVADCVSRRSRLQLRPVYNLTGTVIHTNLGRALLPAQAVEAAVTAMLAPCTLEYDVDRGARSDRDELVSGLICELTGCEAATVVNNNAAAVLLVLNSLAQRKEVLVSRGEQIEIGGSFRMPEIMVRAGCKLREVGTTNRTYLVDYANAICERTALILKVHASNYSIEGFVACPGEKQLGSLAREHRIPLVVDLGSGAIVDLSAWGLPNEPTVRGTLEHGASVVTFSGDKLLGGPQCGIIVGAKELIQRIKRNPISRALRVDKVRLAALEAVLGLYRDPSRLTERLPTLTLLTRPQEEIRSVAARLLPHFVAAVKNHAEVTIEETFSQIGSGAQPAHRLASTAVVVRLVTEGGTGPRIEAVARSFRKLPTPVLGRIFDGALWFDVRCATDEIGLVTCLSSLEFPA
jgi:L-seryl-tRNA(Ser) seleniumtransferase